MTCPSASYETSGHLAFCSRRARKKGNRTPSGRSGSWTGSLGPRYAPSLSVRPTTKKQDKMNSEKTTTEVTLKKHNGSALRPNRMEVNFSDEEWEKLNEMATAAGVNTRHLPTFVRKLALEGKIKSILSAEDRRDISKLNNIGTNLWEVRKKLIDLKSEDELQELVKELYKFKTEFAEILKYFKDKKVKKARRKREV
jgi:hypothetical protein